MVFSLSSHFAHDARSQEPKPNIRLSRLHNKPPNNNNNNNNCHVLLIFCTFFSYKYLLLVMNYNLNKCNNLVTVANTRTRLPEDDADASKHVGVITKNIYIYICITRS